MYLKYDTIKLIFWTYVCAISEKVSSELYRNLWKPTLYTGLLRAVSIFLILFIQSPWPKEWAYGCRGRPIIQIVIIVQTFVKTCRVHSATRAISRRHHCVQLACFNGWAWNFPTWKFSKAVNHILSACSSLCTCLQT